MIIYAILHLSQPTEIFQETKYMHNMHNMDHDLFVSPGKVSCLLSEQMFILPKCTFDIRLRKSGTTLHGLGVQSRAIRIVHAIFLRSRPSSPTHVKWQTGLCLT